MTRSTAALSLVAVTLVLAPLPAAADLLAFKVLRYSSATFKTEAPLETVVGTAAGSAVTGSVLVDPAKPQAALGTIRVDLTALRTGIDKRDADMRGKQYLDTDIDANRFAVFEIAGVEIGGPLEPGREMPAKIKGTLTIKGKPVETIAETRITYLRLTPEQLETQRRFGFSSDNLRVKATFKTSFTNHGMQIPQILFLKLSNDIQLEADLTLVRE